MILNIGDKRENGWDSMGWRRNCRGRQEVVRVRWKDRRRPSLEIPARRSLLSDKLLIPKSWPSSPLNPDKERYLAPEGQKEEHRPGSKSDKTPSPFSFSLTICPSLFASSLNSIFLYPSRARAQFSPFFFFSASRAETSRDGGVSPLSAAIYRPFAQI